MCWLGATPPLLRSRSRRRYSAPVAAAPLPPPQALAATPQLVDYLADDAQLLSDINTTSEFGMGGKIAARLAMLLRRMHGLAEVRSSWRGVAWTIGPS